MLPAAVNHAEPSITSDALSGLARLRASWRGAVRHQSGMDTDELPADGNTHESLMEMNHKGGTLCGGKGNGRLSDKQAQLAGMHALNVWMVSLGLLLTLTASVSIQSLESSLNGSGGIGQGCLALTNAVGIVSATFLSPLLLRKLGPPNILRLYVIPMAVYIIAHYKIMEVTFLLACSIFGLGLVLAVTAGSVVATSAAIEYAAIYGVSRTRMMTRFQSIAYIGFVGSYVIGPLLASLVLHDEPVAGGDSYRSNASDGSGGVLASAGKCDSTRQELHIATHDRYLLLSIYLAIVALAMVFFCLVRSSTERAVKAELASSTVWQKITASIVLFKDLDQLLLVPQQFLSGWTKEMILSNYPKFFVAPCLGISKVGYMVSIFGVFDTAAALLMPRVLERVSRPVVVVVAIAVQLAVLATMVFWTPVPNAALIYSLAGLWGIAEGMMNIVQTVVIGVTFHDRQEAAYSNFRILMGLGFATGAFYSQRFQTCTDQLHRKLYYMAGMVIFQFVLYLVVERRLAGAGRERSLDTSTTSGYDEVTTVEDLNSSVESTLL